VRERDSAADLAAEVWRLLAELKDMAHRRWQRGLSDMGLTTVQANAIMEMANLPPGPMTRLASHLGVDPSWVTGLIDRLEERGDVARRPSLRDRRVKIVELTPGGRLTRESLYGLTYEPLASLLELPEDDLRELLRILGTAVKRQRKQYGS
jgi:DNA-binding MarR family transcriptional regulator